jgi:hypothetical protein
LRIADVSNRGEILECHRTLHPALRRQIHGNERCRQK